MGFHQARWARSTSPDNANLVVDGRLFGQPAYAHEATKHAPQKSKVVRPKVK